MVVDAGQRQRALVLALLGSLLLWNLPFGGFALYPFKLLATWFHELSHGLVMLATGAGFDHLEIYRDTSGIAYAVRGTSAAGEAAIASAGYMGTALFGGVMLVIGQTRRGARSALAVLAALLALTAALWIRNEFGLVSILTVAAVCAGLATVAGERLATFLVNFVAAQFCINAVLDIRVLFRPDLVINGHVVRHSDATAMAKATFGSHWLWACVWLVWSFVVFYVALRIVFLRQRARGGDVATPAAEADAIIGAEPAAEPVASAESRSARS